MSNLKLKIQRILSNHKEARDSDAVLTVYVWQEEQSHLTRSSSLGSFIDLFLDNGFSSTESIRRVRQKLQEHTPALRGEVYYKRHKHQDKVKNYLDNFNK